MSEYKTVDSKFGIDRAELSVYADCGWKLIGVSAKPNSKKTEWHFKKEV
jgi:hypothetical protein